MATYLVKWKQQDEDHNYNIKCKTHSKIWMGFLYTILNNKSWKDHSIVLALNFLTKEKW